MSFRGLIKNIEETLTAGGAGSIFGDVSTHNSIDNDDSYARGDSRRVTSIYKPKKRKKKNTLKEDLLDIDVADENDLDSAYPDVRFLHKEYYDLEIIDLEQIKDNIIKSILPKVSKWLKRRDVKLNLTTDLKSLVMSIKPFLGQDKVLNVGVTLPKNNGEVEVLISIDKKPILHLET